MAEILADAPHADPATLKVGDGVRVRRVLDRLGLGVSNVNCNCSFSYWRHAPPEPYFEPSLISPEPQYRVDRRERIFRAIDFAAEVGAPAVSITSGRCLGRVSPMVAGKILAENLVPVLEYAEKAGVNVGMECEPGLFVEYARELKEVMREVEGSGGGRRLGANLDTGHSVVLGESLREAFDVLRGRIWNTHVEDLPDRKHWHMVPGAAGGSFPWGELEESMRAAAYEGPMTVELYTHTDDPHEAALASYRFLSTRFGSGR
jgi:sugar phosphate isomerase/epimerase